MNDKKKHAGRKPEVIDAPVVYQGDRFEGEWFKEFTLDTPMERLDNGPHKAKLQALIDTVAALTVSGMLRKDIAKQVGIDDESVDKILHRPDCSDKIKKIGESAISTAKTRIRSRILLLVDDMYSVIEEHVREKRSLQGVAMGLKILGIEQEEKTQTASTSMTVILPGAGGQDKIKITEKK